MKNKVTTSLPATAEVLIVGYGPVGAALTALLGRYGIDVVVIDKVEDVLLMPRAIALDNEALRILQMIGLDESAFERIGIPEVKMHCPFMGQFGQVNSSGGIDGHPKLVTFYQPDLEHALRRQGGRFGTVSFHSGLELISFNDVEDGVVANLRDESGAPHHIQVRYLVGADGASSRVRTLIGQDFRGQSYSEDWLIVDVREREGKAIDHVEFICDPKRPTPHMPAPGGRERWEFMLRPGETREQMEKPETVARLLSDWIDPKDLVIERKAVYRFHARCCEAFSQGRVFLVGDAAHITPPFVGQGLVAGLRDVANLAWKLAWVLRGRAAPALLDSYDRERRPHAKEMIKLAKFMGVLVMPRNRLSAWVLHGTMRLVRAIPPVRRYMDELEIKPSNRFKAGCFQPGGGAAPLVRGGQLPQQWVRQEGAIRLSDDVLGDGLTLVGFGIDPSIHLDGSTRSRWRARGGRFLQIGSRGQNRTTSAPFAEDLSDGLVPGLPRDWMVVVRPDRVIMHDGPAERAATLVDECLRMLGN